MIFNETFLFFSPKQIYHIRFVIKSVSIASIKIPKSVKTSILQTKSSKINQDKQVKYNTRVNTGK